MQNITMLITNIISYKVFCSFIYLSAKTSILVKNIVQYIYLKLTQLNVSSNWLPFTWKLVWMQYQWMLKSGRNTTKSFACDWHRETLICYTLMVPSTAENNVIHIKRKSQRPFSKHKQTFKDDIIFASAGHYTVVNSLIHCFEH